MFEQRPLTADTANAAGLRRRHLADERLIQRLVAKSHALDFEEQRRATRKAIQFEIKYEFDTEAQTFSGTRPRGETLREEFENFLEGYKLPEGIDRETLKSAGMEFAK